MDAAVDVFLDAGRHHRRCAVACAAQAGLIVLPVPGIWKDLDRVGGKQEED